MKRSLVLVSTLLLATVALAACGTKGPLVLPDQQSTAKKKAKATPAQQTPPAPTQPAPDSGKQP